MNKLFEKIMDRAVEAYGKIERGDRIKTLTDLCRPLLGNLPFEWEDDPDDCHTLILRVYDVPMESDQALKDANGLEDAIYRIFYKHPHPDWCELVSLVSHEDTSKYYSQFLHRTGDCSTVKPARPHPQA